MNVMIKMQKIDYMYIDDLMFDYIHNFKIDETQFHISENDKYEHDVFVTTITNKNTNDVLTLITDVIFEHYFKFTTTETIIFNNVPIIASDSNSHLINDTIKKINPNYVPNYNNLDDCILAFYINYYLEYDC